MPSSWFITKTKKKLGTNKKNGTAIFGGIAQSLYPQSGQRQHCADDARSSANSRSRITCARRVYVLIGSSPSRQFLQKIGIVQKRLTTAALAAEASDALLRRLKLARPRVASAGCRSRCPYAQRVLGQTAGSFVDTQR